MKGWWSISDDALMDSLNRCWLGEEPYLVYAELYANSEIVSAASAHSAEEDLGEEGLGGEAQG